MSQPSPNLTTESNSVSQEQTSSPILDSINTIYQQCRGLNHGSPASYIPELAKVNSDLFGICLVTADGEIYEVGDSQVPFTIQSISKPFVYGLALADCGREEVLRRVGVEPTGQAFNSILLDQTNNRPYNPMVNSGAIAVTSLVKGNSYDQRFQRILQFFERFAGRNLSVDEAVFESEQATGHRNRAIAYLELNFEMIEEPINEHLDLYFRQCSILVTARDLAVMAATLANNGINPVTGVRAISAEVVTAMLSVMASCGMYDFSGEWLYRIGLPAKSGVGGGIIAALPGQFGVGTFAPPLDERGNSVRGIKVCQELSSRYNFHLFDVHAIAQNFVSRTYSAAEVASKRQRRVTERNILRQEGHKIAVYELQGDLYFATLEKLFRQLQTRQSQLSFLLLDGRRIGQADSSALSLLQIMKQWLEAKEIRLLFSGFSQPIYSLFEESGWPQELFFSNVDAALEWSENKLLGERLSAHHEGEKFSLAAMDIFCDFDAKDIEAIAPLFDEMYYQPEDLIIREGDPADRLYLLASGKATVSLKLGDSGKRKRLTTYIPGIAFGELCLFEPGKRSADIVADTEACCYVLPIARLNRLLDNTPEVYVKLLRAFGKNLVDTLRRLTTEVRSLSSS